MIRNWVGFYTLSSREVLRFFAVWKQTIIPGVVTTLLYIFVFGIELYYKKCFWNRILISIL